MSEVRLAHAVAPVTTPPSGKVLPFLALDHVEPGMGRLLRGVELEHRSPTDVGMIEAMPGDVLFGKLRPYLAKSLRLEQQSLVSGEFIVLRPRARVDTRWLSYLVLSTAFVRWAVASSEGAKMPRTSWEKLRQFRLPVLSGDHGSRLLLPRAEQTRIADFLDMETSRIDGLIRKRVRAFALLAARRESLYFAGTSGCLTSFESREPVDIPWLPTAPASWPTVLLKLVARLGSGHTPSRSHPEWWVPAECVIPWITTGEVAQLRSDRQEVITETRERISRVGLANSAAELHPAGTVVLSRTASVGYSAIMSSDMATSQDFATWTCSPLLRAGFLLLCLRAMRRDLLGRLAVGSTHKTIYMPDIEAIRIPLPPVEEQDRIVEAVERRLNPINLAEDGIRHQIHLLRERRQALITAAVTGQIDITRGAA